MIASALNRSVAQCAILGALALTLIALVIVPANSYASPRNVTVNVETTLEPKSVVGMLVSSKRTIEKLSAKIERRDDRNLVVTFEFSPTEVDQDSLATAFIISASGEMAFGEMRPVFLDAPDVPFWQIPECPVQKISSLGPEDEATLAQIVQIREMRRQVSKAIIARGLNEDLLPKLIRVEKAFGLARSADLSADLPPLELVDRFNRIAEAIRAHKSGKDKRAQ